MKRMLFAIWLIVLIFPTTTSLAQHGGDIGFVLDKINANYAGLPFKKKLNADSLLKQNSLLHVTDTFRVLAEILLFYNDRHLIIYDFKNAAFKEDSTLLKHRADSLTVYLQKAAISTGKRDPAEGYWKIDYNNCIVAMIKSVNSKTSYNAYVVESSAGIPAGSRLFSLTRKGNSFVTDYTDPDFKYRFFCISEFSDRFQTLTTGPYGRWEKITNYQQNTLLQLNRFSYAPELYPLDSSTVIFRLPDCSPGVSKKVDSLINLRKEILANCKTLIIDVRNNAGGVVNAYYPILPYVNTGNIISQSAYQYSSADIIDNKKASLERAIKNGRLQRAETLKKEIDTMEKKPGQFIFFKGDTLKFDTPFQKPANVAIIANYGTMSAAELLLLDCMQSRKVTVFGEPTAGANDFLDFYATTTPFGNYELYIPSVKRIRTATEHTDPFFKILPDRKITRQTKDWIEYIRRYYEKN